jgi:hypothetical protein
MDVNDLFQLKLEIRRIEALLKAILAFPEAAKGIYDVELLKSQRQALLTMCNRWEDSAFR